MSVIPTRREIERFRVLVRRQLGLDLDEARSPHLVDVLRRRLEAFRATGAQTYLERLGAGGRDEWRMLARELTVGETYFFRYRDHFRAFAEVVLPEVTSVLGRPRVLRFLSAGAASGEEAYSLAMLVREHLRSPGEWDVRIVGIDVNPKVVEKAVSARYSAWSLRDTPEDVRERYFRAEDRTFALIDAIRSMVSFEERNLVEDDPAFWRPEAFDVVFCRNVLMYLTEDATRAIVGRMSRALRPGGFLFLGHAETLRGLTHDYHLRHTHDTFYYQLRRDRTEAGSSVPLPAPREADAAYRARPIDVAAGGADELSWVEAIKRASERIATLTERATPDAASAPPVRPRVDRPMLLEMLQKERFAEALGLFDELPETVRCDTDGRLLHAVLLTNAGRLREAEDACQRLLAIDEMSAGAHYVTALCREHAGDVASAVDHDQTAIYLEPGFAMPRLHLGVLERRAGQLEQARVDLGQALALLPGEDAPRIVLLGGGFGRHALMEMCRSELRMCGGER